PLSLALWPALGSIAAFAAYLRPALPLAVDRRWAELERGGGKRNVAATPFDRLLDYPLLLPPHRQYRRRVARLSLCPKGAGGSLDLLVRDLTTLEHADQSLDEVRELEDIAVPGTPDERVSRARSKAESLHTSPGHTIEKVTRQRHDVGLTLAQ